MNLINKVSTKMQKEGLMNVFFAIIRYPLKLIRNYSHKKILKSPNLSDRFISIYEKNFWQSTESKSGEGSEIDYTRNIRDWLVKKIPELDIKTFVDAPCGDFNWMKEVLPKVDISYIGLDIVPSLIKSNEDAYASTKISFGIADICKDSLPSCDMLMVRDCLFHLSFNDINRFFKNISELNYKYLLTTSHIVNNDFENINIESGNFRLINLFKKPFNFKESIILDRVNDFPEGYRIPREMILLEKRNVPTSINL